MTTAVVVTSIVTTNLGEAGCLDHLLEQIRTNDRSLLNRLSAVDGEATVVTAVLDLAEFVTYASEWLHRRQTTPPEFKFPEPAFGEMDQLGVATGVSQPATAATTVVTDHMSEVEFMDYTLHQMRQSNGVAVGQYSGAALAAIEEEPIGEDFARRPFLY
jgi:hypothetical protein